MSDAEAAIEYATRMVKTTPATRGQWTKKLAAVVKITEDAFLAGVAHERERAAKIAWRLQSTQFGGGTAIGNAIQDPPAPSDPHPGGGPPAAGG